MLEFCVAHRVSDPVKSLKSCAGSKRNIHNFIAIPKEPIYFHEVQAFRSTNFNHIVLQAPLTTEVGIEDTGLSLQRYNLVYIFQQLRDRVSTVCERDVWCSRRSYR